MKTADIETQAYANLDVLSGRIRQVRSKYITVRVALGVVLAATVLWAVFGSEMLLDWLFGFEWPVRLICFLAAWGGAAWFVWREVLPPLLRRPTDDEVALMIERGMPVFQTRFISSIQLTRNPPQNASRRLCRALLAETASEARRLKFHWVVKTGPLRRAMRTAVPVVLVVAGLWYAGGPASPVLLARAFLMNVPLPPKTRMESVTGEASVGVGDDLLIEARVSGIIPSSGRLIVEREGGVRQTHSMIREGGDKHRFALNLTSIQEPFTYRVEINDAKAGPFNVKTIVQPTIREVTSMQYFPEYLHEPPRRRSTGDLSLMAGSKLQVHVTSSEMLNSAQLELKPDGTSVAMEVSAEDPLKAVGWINIPPKGLDGFSVKLTDRNGLTSSGAAVYRINIVPDRVPVVEITFPQRREELATASARALLAFEASDDFGIAEVKLHFTTEPENPEAARAINLNLEAIVSKTVARRFEWDLGKLKPPLAEGAVLEFWVEALDANTVTGPGSGVSDRHFLRIVSPADKRIDLANRLNDTISGVSDLRESQQQAHKSLGEAIFQKVEE